MKRKGSNELMMNKIEGLEDVYKFYKSHTIHLRVQKYQLEAQTNKIEFRRK